MKMFFIGLSFIFTMSAYAYETEKWTSAIYKINSDKPRLSLDNADNCVKYMTLSCEQAHENGDEDLAYEATFDVQSKDGTLQSQKIRVAYSLEEIVVVDTGILGYATMGITSLLATGVVSTYNVLASDWGQKTIAMCEQIRASIARRMCQ
ncbi:MAG: hypothetical protein SGJ18_10285 [Pseudomonadota bacterium]|mgnify:CR=1 FL=1|nr:hypothetical protein [Pseudomonadota bacterium]